MDQWAHASDETAREMTVWVGRVAAFTVSVPELGLPDVAISLLTSEGRIVELQFLDALPLFEPHLKPAHRRDEKAQPQKHRARLSRE